ncbi:MAG: hypothetical protein CR986_09790 [Ignavibacteriae bacterium]|nr:MAG: hypothetical protein CR986_09790 [Ignavibacteriota bacterium]
MKKVKHLIIILIMALLSSSCIGVNREFKNIRSSIMGNINDDFKKEFEFSVGPVGFFIVNQFVRFSDTDAKENIEQILNKVNNIHIGIYNRLSNSSKLSFGLFKELSKSVINESWKPIIKTVSKNELVGIFIKELDADHIRELFVVTLSSEELVLVKLEGNIGAIIDQVIKSHSNNLRVTGYS